MTDTAIFAISLGVTLVGLVISWGVYRRRGAGTGLRGVALSLVPLAAALTGVTEFFVDLAFSPVKWAGVAVAGLAVVLYLASGAMISRRAGAAGGGGGGGEAAGPWRAPRRAPTRRWPRSRRSCATAASADRSRTAPVRPAVPVSGRAPRLPGDAHPERGRTTGHARVPPGRLFRPRPARAPRPPPPPVPAA